MKAEFGIPINGSPAFPARSIQAGAHTHTPKAPASQHGINRKAGIRYNRA